MKTPAVFIWMYADSDLGISVLEGQKGGENDLLKNNNYFFGVMYNLMYVISNSEHCWLVYMPEI